MAFRSALLWLLVPAAGSEQSPAPALTTSGAFFALSVPDLAASTRWYKEKLGLKVVLEVPRQGKTAVTVLEGGGLTVELLQHADARPRSGDAELTHGPFKVGVLLDNYEQAVATLRARSVEVAYGPFPARDGQRANVIIRDNAGNLIQLFGK